MSSKYDPIAEAERRAFASDDAATVKAMLNGEQIRPRIPVVKVDNTPKDINLSRRVIAQTQESETYKKLFGSNYGK